jgi:LacI family transcriptional regulator
MLRNRWVDGIIIVPVSNIEEGKIERLNPDIPMVFVDRYFKSFRTSRVIINNYEVSKLATQLLSGKGCKKIAFITYRESLMHMQDRKHGFMDALRLNNSLDEQLICEADYSTYQQEVVDFIKRISREELAIDGLFISAGSLSATAIRCMVRTGIKLQSDVQLIGFGKIDIVTDVSIPYVKQPMEEICKNSFDILIGRIKTQDSKPVSCVVPASIVSN